MEEGDLGECLKHRDGGDGEQKHIPASCWTHSPLFVLQMVWGGKSRLSTSSALTSIWGSLPFVSIPENSRSPSAEMCTCPGKVFLHLSPASLLDSLLAPCSLLVLPITLLLGWEQHGHPDYSCRTPTPRLCYVQPQLFALWALLQTSAPHSTETSIIWCLHQGE